MIDFIKLVENVLEEQEKSTQDLFKNNVVSENTFFKYKHRYPSLKTLIKIANYLKVSLDYLFEFTNENQFEQYKEEKIHFYKNLINYINSKKISARQFCKNLSYSKDNVLRWKKGVLPTLQRLLEITDYFGCSIDDLIK